MSDIRELFGLKNHSATPSENLKTALSCCDNVGQMLDLLRARYDLENCKPGSITKKLVVDGLAQAVEMLNPPKK